MRSRDRRRRPAALSFTHVALGAVLFVAVNIVADGTLRGVRLDLTEERRYTISDGTINVLGSLEEPIRLKLYFSCLLYTSPSPRDGLLSRMPSSA